MHTIDELEREIREMINAPRRHEQLRANSYDFSQLCSSLDVIGDTELALEAYLAGSGGGQSDGDLYLRVYGRDSSCLSCLCRIGAVTSLVRTTGDMNVYA